MNFRTSLAVFTLALTTAVMPAVAAMSSDETNLETERQNIDKTTSADTKKVDTLSKQYDVKPETVQGLRDGGQGWGEVSVGMATAQELFKNDPKTYPTYADALKKVQDMRASGEGWGKIAKDLGFKLGPVVSASRHTTNELRKEGSEHPNHDASGNSNSNHDHPGKPEHTGKPDMTGRPDHSAKPDHPGKPDRPNH